ncbi:MAG: segregation and condensation protein A [Oscillospiraceae bacterium]
MEEPTYHLAGVMHTRDELPADFDGPLSVILLLLSKNKIEIQDVSITSILEQYLAYLDEMKRLDMEIASEFIAMASHLMLIKTKMLLSAAEREEAMSEMELLIRSLEEKQRAEAYEQIRTAVAFLEPRSDIGNGFSACAAAAPSGRDLSLPPRAAGSSARHGGHGRAQRAASAAEALEFSGHRRR